jgi:hypothetical protein
LRDEVRESRKWHQRNSYTTRVKKAENINDKFVREDAEIATGSRMSRNSVLSLNDKFRMYLDH